MLIGFLLHLRQGGLKIGIGEYLTLLAGIKQGVVPYTLDDFYQWARLCLIKDERLYDRFDKLFGQFWAGVEADSPDFLNKNIPDEWLKSMVDRVFTEEEKAQIEALGGFEKLMETLQERLKEQHERHEGGNKWIGTGGTSPFGSGGYNPEGVRIGNTGKRQGRATKVWEAREFKDLDGDLSLGTRNIQLALRRLRRFARTGAADIFDIDQTISATANNAGWLDLKFMPERHNAMKLLLLFDIGGSMDSHIKMCEELFSAARSEFKHLEFYYFHNFIYESVWKNNQRRRNERTSLTEILHKYNSDWRVIFIGDASMSPYEILAAGGSVEHWNQEAGAVYFKEILRHFPKTIWLNPVPAMYWEYTQSIQIVQELLESERMFGLTLRGLEDAMKYLVK